MKSTADIQENLIRTYAKTNRQGGGHFKPIDTDIDKSSPKRPVHPDYI